MTKIQIIRCLFLLILPFLFAQFVFTLTVEEPYPAVLFPFFSGAGPSDGIYKNRQEKIVVFADKDTLSYSQNDLFGDMPESHRHILMEKFLGVYTDSILYRNRAFVDWFGKRIKKISQRDKIDQVIVQWYEVSYNTNNQPIQAERNLISEFYFKEW